MLTTDSLTRFMFENAAVRGEIVSLDDTWREILQRVEYPPFIQHLLGELTAAAALLIATLKFEGSLVLQMQSDSAVRLLVVEVTSSLTLRAMAKWEGDVDEAEFDNLLHNGRLVMTLDPAKEGRQAYQGVVPLSGHSVAEALMHYMTQSEQIDTRIVLAADDQSAGGMLIQRLPDQPAGDADAWDRAGHLLSTLKQDELLKLDARIILHRLFHEEDLRVFDSEALSFRCSCSRTRVANMLKMLGREEIDSVLEEQGQVDVQCEFCGRRYRFDPVDAAQLWLETLPIPEGQTRH